MSKGLQQNQLSWEKKYNTTNEQFEKYRIEKQEEIADLKDQIRDLMFYMEAQNVVANSQLKDEIANTSISISQPAESSTKKSRKKK